MEIELLRKSKIMILNEDELQVLGFRLISRHILMGELALIQKGTNRIFIPLVEDVIQDVKTGKMERILSNKHFRRNAKTLSNEFKMLDANWNTIFRFNPQTLEFVDRKDIQ